MKTSPISKLPAPRSLLLLLALLLSGLAAHAAVFVQPTISATPASLTGFTAPIGNASASQSFTVNGTLLEADITVTAPANFQVSSNNSSFSQNLTLTQSGGNVTTTTLYARLTSAALPPPIPHFPPNRLPPCSPCRRENPLRARGRKPFRILPKNRPLFFPGIFVDTGREKNISVVRRCPTHQMPPSSSTRQAASHAVARSFKD